MSDKRDHPDWRIGEQRLVVYEGPNGDERIYTTAYSNTQQRHATEDCTKRYTTAVNARAVYSKERRPT